MSMIPRLTDTERYILRQLLHDDHYGRQLALDSDGKLDLKTIYTILARMVDKRVIEGRPERVAAPDGKGGPPRRIYRITPRGRRALAAYAAGEAQWRSTAAR